VTLPSDTIAVVVGIEEYWAGREWRLDGPALDACRFARWLTARGVPPDKITLLVSPLPENADEVRSQSQDYRLSAEATHAAIRDVFTGYLPSERSGLLILYWGGHGVLEEEERRLIYADATKQDKRNLNLSSLLKSMRSSTFAGHSQQLVFVDACLNLVTELGWEGRMPNEEFTIGRPEPRRDQRVLLAASPGERAVNVDALKTGLFSQVLREELGDLPTGWPPDAERLRDSIKERFEQLREEGRTQQTPSNLWFRSRSVADTLVFTSGSNAGRAGAAAVGAQLLNYAEYRELKTILYGAPAPRHLLALYRQATRDVLEYGLPRRPDDLMSTIGALRNPVRKLPLFEFLVRLAAGSDLVTQERLWVWIHDVAPKWDVDPNELHAIDAELRRTCVLLRLELDLLDDGLQVTGWMYEGRDGRQVLTADEPWDRSRLALEVGRLVDQFGLDEEQQVKPIIEFLIPLAMLDDDLESLRVRMAGREKDIGTTFPVVVRPLERIADPGLRGCWRDVWDHLIACGDGYDEGAICWIEYAPTDGRFDPACLRAGVCMALAYARPGRPDQDPVLRAALSMGTPVALWHRTSQERTARRAALEQVLGHHGLRELPDVVFGQRIAAQHPSATVDHAGHGLVLLWDDPDRVPPELEWHPPALEGVAP
jgi:hypothetical protein